MAVYYRCRQCGTQIGEVEIDGETEQKDLGFESLSKEEQLETLSVDGSGHVHVKILCDICHEAIHENPVLHEHNHWIH